MRTFAWVAAITVMISGVALGQSTIDYTLQLGGDPDAAGWESGSNPVYSGGSDADSQVFDCDTDPASCLAVTWDAVVEVTGIHTDGDETNGATCLVFNLELRGPAPATDLVETVVFFSAINDGDVGPPLQPDDPLEVAAFCHKFNVDGNGPTSGGAGRAWDDDSAGGPYMRRAQYPTCGTHGGGRVDQSGNHVVGGTPVGGLSNAQLIGMGCGYPQFNPAMVGGPATAGVGIDPFAFGPVCERGLGILPIFQGEMDLSGIEVEGDYTLTLIPSTGNNIMPGSFDCEFGDPTAFSEAADVVNGDSIVFHVIPGPPPCLGINATEWRSIRTHGGAGALPITLDAAAGAGDATTDPRQGGIQLIEVDFDQDVTNCYSPGQVSLTGGAGTVTGDQLINGGTTLEITITGTSDEVCYTIDLTGSVNGLVDPDCDVATLTGDTNNDQAVNVLDRSLVKNNLGVDPASSEAKTRIDVNADGAINVLDRSLVKNSLGGVVSCP